VGTSPEQAVDAINAVSGRHDGYRAAHAKGVLVTGTFTATPEAAALTRAAHMQGESTRVTARFSNGSGNPKGPDSARDGRGLAVKFYLPDDTRTDIVAVTLPCFFVNSPDDFVKFTRAAKPIGNTEIPSPALLLFLATHRSAWRAARAGMALKPPPSYANCRYNAIHSFRWADAGGGERWVRYSWLPEAGEESISSDEANRRGRNYLQDEMPDELAKTPMRFALQVQIAADGDPIDDATAVWPDDRETVAAGTLEITGMDTERERDPGDVLVFDPTRVTDGIELSDDPILRFRSPAYSVSVKRRSGAVKD